MKNKKAADPGEEAAAFFIEGVYFMRLLNLLGIF